MKRFQLKTKENLKNKMERKFKLEDFDYEVPKELIAQKHVMPRDRARMMVVKDKIYHKHFYELPEYLEKGDVIVINNTRVIPAKIFGRKETGGKVELLLIKKISSQEYECLISGKNIKENSNLIFDNFKAKILSKENGKFIVKFEKDINDFIYKRGEMPLPHYIKEKLENKEEYQTVYSKKIGAIAAPTAGLHFTKKLINELKSKGVIFAEITLHVSLGTFRPVHNIETHKMDEEYYEVSEEAAEIINKAFENEKNIFAVGTTSVKTLETVADQNGLIQPKTGFSDLFIKPGYNFKTKIKAMITNFHIPKSTLIMMVCAFGGYERVMNAYREAIKEKYKFYSFGDSMLLFR
ncbi:MAG: tRNA preQ1(34) S-adenosylmethionine ribosyltransferase-isomerase QueA [Candidatus Woesearchaeota archaeon]